MRHGGSRASCRLSAVAGINAGDYGCAEFHNSENEHFALRSRQNYCRDRTRQHFRTEFLTVVAGSLAVQPETDQIPFFSAKRENLRRAERSVLPAVCVSRIA